MIFYQKIQKSYFNIMELTGNGLNKGSHMYFYSASQNAKKLLYYPMAAGEFYCNGEYCVERDNYNNILAMYVLDGNITARQNDIELDAQKDELLLIDCRRAHKYFTESEAHTLWVHFNGNNTYEWFHEITAQKGQKIRCGRQTAGCILNVINKIRYNQNEYDISSELYSLLCDISKVNYIYNGNKTAERIEDAKKFIMSNYDKNISIRDMSDAVYMSASYFSKIFKKNTGFSPYDYLLLIRIDKAKELLKQTDDTVESIAYKTGFNSLSNFICFFKKEMGVSPLRFRNIKF